MDGQENQPDAMSGTMANAQSHFVRAAKVPTRLYDQAKPGDPIEYRTRDWSFFFFFRIMSQAEVNATQRRVGELLEAGAKAMAKAAGLEGESPAESWAMGTGTPADTLLYDLALPSMVNAGMEDWKRNDPVAAGDGDGQEGAEGAAAAAAPPRVASAPDGSADIPAQAFRDWLTLLTSPDKDLAAKFAEQLKALIASAQGVKPLSDMFIAEVEALGALSQLTPSPDAGAGVSTPLEYLEENHVTILNGVRQRLRAHPEAKGVLAQLALYEFLRQGAPAFARKMSLSGIRSGTDEVGRDREDETFDRTPTSFAFTYSGLEMLKLHPGTLASFPDAFKQGMAARAERLGDVGASAPENWEGELGLPSVHGFFTCGSNLDIEGPMPESFWKNLRAEVRAYNDPRRADIPDRAMIGHLFRLVGLEILHIELGQDPYHVVRDPAEGEKGTIRPIRPRKEHFGFRDGLSQPFVDLKLGDTLPGGGTASRRGTWAPVARGEIFLDQLDESGHSHTLPLNKDLRQGSTFLVFRKLEQDVFGFHSFLALQRPEGEQARHRLGAQFVGRWKNGTPLVRSPTFERAVDGEAEAVLNDFRYDADDPLGSKCPLGAHIRRANPRDIGGRNDVRHHRLLRRGISYGGALLEEGDADDGEKRGILFVAANARIDLQFEVVQGDWINSGEFLGQAGLGRCPITGSHDGTAASTFLEAGAVAPVRGLPSFVTMRGGDYFFAPGITAMLGIAKGDAFEGDAGEVPHQGHCMGATTTLALFEETRLKGYAGRMMASAEQVIRLQAPQSDKIAFVARHADVRKVLGNEVNAGGGVDFSVWPYRDAGRRITRGEDFLIGTDAAGSPSRTRLLTILGEGWNTLATERGDFDAALREAAARRLDVALRRTAGGRRIDLVDDLAVAAAYGVVADILGVPGPPWLTELAAALPFARQHVGELPRDWIAAFKGERASNPPLTTMQVWTAVLVADLIANVQSQQALQGLARQAGSEMLTHIDIKLAEARAGRSLQQFTLVDAFASNESNKKIMDLYPGSDNPANPVFNMWRGQYYKDCAIILLEIVGSTLAVVPLTFASVMTTLLRLRIDLPLLLPVLDEDGVSQLIYEAERLTPNVPVRMRRCEAATAFGASRIDKGDMVAALIGAAGMDPRVFADRKRFSLAPHDGRSDGPHRKRADYLLFGVEGSNKDCWGRNRVALPILRACVQACGRLQGLRRVAGPRGEPRKMAGVTIGLLARFTEIISKPAEKP